MIMLMAIICNDALKTAFLARGMNAGMETVFIDSIEQVPAGAGIVFDLLFDNEQARVAALARWLPRPVIINSVTATLAQVGQPFIRLNAWQGFLQHPILEIAALPAQQSAVQEVFAQLGWQYRLVPDIAGLVSARVIAMIINEAWFTFGEGISTREEIDIAMKSGTNYPYGPFEWSDKIGLQHISRLLSAMRIADSRYEIAPALQAAGAAE
jgi:3-hydroxybutyryl-CoA dehydrogenase